MKSSENKQSLLWVLSCFCASLLLACSSAAPLAVPPAPPTLQSAPLEQAIGVDLDAHGCNRAAGFSWCVRENACVHPWEVTKQKNLGEGAEAFRAYCASPATKAP